VIGTGVTLEESRPFRGCRDTWDNESSILAKAAWALDQCRSWQGAEASWPFAE
jgi:hypothetical protein